MHASNIFNMFTYVKRLVQRIKRTLRKAKEQLVYPGKFSRASHNKKS
jgi:hypothetical protein